MSDVFVPIVGGDYPKAVIPYIEAAKKNIDLVSYDWRWYQDQATHPVQRFNIALVRAVQRGVQVRAVLNSQRLIPILKKVGIDARRLRDHRTLHTKLVIIDDEIAIIGSHNFTRNAFAGNVETSLIVSIPRGSDRLRTFFDNLFAL